MQKSDWKPVALVLAILLGFLAHSGPARAAKIQTAILAGGCFWCVESDFESVPGVIDVVSGFTGGHLRNPTYKQVSHGGTGHFEAVKITFDSAALPYERLLYLFMRSIDPTDAGGQFCDRGDSYRTAIFVRGAAQRKAAENAIREAQAALGHRIATQILPASRFYKAESYHQNYYRGTKIVLTRRGPKTQANAYAFYRKACGRDARVRALWGAQAPFANSH